jgi:hypothetical protein
VLSLILSGTAAQKWSEGHGRSTAVGFPREYLIVIYDIYGVPNGPNMFITQAWNISQLDAVYRTSTKSREIGWRSERNRLNRLITRTSDSIECIVDRCSRLQRLQGSACSADADLAFLGGALLVESMGGGHRDLIQSLSAQIPRAQSCSNYMDKTWENRWK